MKFMCYNFKSSKKFEKRVYKRLQWRNENRLKIIENKKPLRQRSPRETATDCKIIKTHFFKLLNHWPLSLAPG